MFAAASGFALPEQQCEKLNLKVKCGSFLMHMISRQLFGGLNREPPAWKESKHTKKKAMHHGFALVKQKPRKILGSFLPSVCCEFSSSREARASQHPGFKETGEFTLSLPSFQILSQRVAYCFSEFL